MKKIYLLLIAALLGIASANANVVIYFDNSNSNWTTPHIHYWDKNNTGSAWPGVAMTKVEGNVWMYNCPDGTTGICFNAGDGDTTKTGDFVAINNHIYNTGGDLDSIFYQLHGQLTGNKDWETVDMTNNNGVWEYTGSLVAGEFGIRQCYTDSSSTYWIGGSATITEANKSYSFTKGNDSSSNLEGTYTIKYNPTNNTIEFSGDESTPDPEVTYILHGSCFSTDGAWSDVTLTEKDGKLVAENVIVNKNGGANFGIKKVSNGEQIAWIWNSGSSANIVSGTTYNCVIQNSNNGAEWTFTESGQYNFTFDPDAMKLTVTTVTKDYSSWYCNLQGDFNGWSNDDGVLFSKDGKATIKNLAIGTGNFQIKVWDGAYDTYYGKSGAVNQNENITVAAGVNFGMTIKGAAAGDKFDVSFDIETKVMVVTKVSSDPEIPTPTATVYVYFDNTGTGWNAPYVYTYNTETAGKWPGETMTNVSGNLWIYEFKGTTIPAKIIFNNGKSGDGEQKTGDLDFVNHATYKSDGSSFLPTTTYELCGPFNSKSVKFKREPGQTNIYSAYDVECSPTGYWSDLYIKETREISEGQTIITYYSKDGVVVNASTTSDFGSMDWLALDSRTDAPGDFNTNNFNASYGYDFYLKFDANGKAYVAAVQGSMIVNRVYYLYYNHNNEWIKVALSTPIRDIYYSTHTFKAGDTFLFSLRDSGDDNPYDGSEDYISASGNSGNKLIGTEDVIQAYINNRRMFQFDSTIEEGSYTIFLDTSNDKYYVSIEAGAIEPDEYEIKYDEHVFATDVRKLPNPAKMFNDFKVTAPESETTNAQGYKTLVMPASGDGGTFAWAKYESTARYSEAQLKKSRELENIDNNTSNTQVCINFSDAFYRGYYYAPTRPSVVGTPTSKGRRNPKAAPSRENEARVALTTFVENNTTGIEDIVIDGENAIDNSDAPVMWYNLQGVRVENPSNGIYIRVQGSQRTKEYVR